MKAYTPANPTRAERELKKSSCEGKKCNHDAKRLPRKVEDRLAKVEESTLVSSPAGSAVSPMAQAYMDKHDVHEADDLVPDLYNANRAFIRRIVPLVQPGSWNEAGGCAHEF